MLMRINSAKDLIVYKRAYELSMQIFELTKRFPPEERFALTGQVRRSLSCAPKMTPPDAIDFRIGKDRKSDEEAVLGRADRGHPA